MSVTLFIFPQGLSIVKDGWFTELSTMWPGQGISIQVKEVLFQGKSDFQVRHYIKWILETW